MPSRPFPYPLNIGTDICHTRRISELLLKPDFDARPKALHRFLQKFLTSREQRDFWRLAGGKYSNVLREPNQATVDAKCLKYMAGRWAAKEAVIKAVKYRKLGFMHVQILKSKPSEAGSGPLYALILDRPASAYESYATSKLDFEKTTRTHSARSSDISDNQAAESEKDFWEAAQDTSAREGLADDAEPRSGRRKARSLYDGDFTPAEMQDDELDGQVARISISHDGEYATAVCLAVQEPAVGDVGGEAVAREP